MAERVGRREVVRAALMAGVAGPALRLLEGTVRALPRGDETDLAVLDAALSLEHHAIAIYDLGLKRQLFPPGLKHYAVAFKGDHQGHRDTQIAIAEDRGRKPAGPFARYDLSSVRDGGSLLREALMIEVVAQRAYTALISQIRAKDYLLSAAFILVDEVRHMTVWQRALGLRIY